jgi:hypothetical protein
LVPQSTITYRYRFCVGLPLLSFVRLLVGHAPGMGAIFRRSLSAIDPAGP